jgi:membrane associated rhomboid family serine protease
MFPFGDNLRAEGSLIGVLLLIGLLIAAHLPVFLDPSLELMVLRSFAFVPAWFSVSPWPNIHRLVSSVFLHGDFFHVAGNCLFLWVFGRSLQRLFGTGLFLVTFPLLGVCGLLLHWVIYPNSRVPVIGASGAVATLMGAYLALFPKARVKLFVLLGGFGAPIAAPAWVFLFYWGGLELLSLAFGSGDADRVAYAVHVGGFIAGVIGAMIWRVAYPYAEEQLIEFTKGASGSTNVRQPSITASSGKTPAVEAASNPNPTLPTSWFIFRDGQQYGPVDAKDFQDFVDRGELLRTDFLWHANAPDWFPATQYVRGEVLDDLAAGPASDDLAKVMVQIKAHLGGPRR